MTPPITLASTSPVRLALLQRAGLPVVAIAPRIDEAALRGSLLADGAAVRDIADALAEAKAVKVARRHAGLVLGCDQILSCEGRLFSKAPDRATAARHLGALQGRAHLLHAAVVACRDGAPVWRHVAEARLTMRRLSARQIDAYLDSAWPAVAGAVGCYHIEGPGLRLFREIEGEHTAILGLPVPPLLAWLDDRGELG